MQRHRPMKAQLLNCHTLAAVDTRTLAAQLIPRLPSVTNAEQPCSLAFAITLSMSYRIHSNNQTNECWQVLADNGSSSISPLSVGQMVLNFSLERQMVYTLWRFPRVQQQKHINFPDPENFYTEMLGEIIKCNGSTCTFPRFFPPKFNVRNRQVISGGQTLQWESSTAIRPPGGRVQVFSGTVPS